MPYKDKDAAKAHAREYYLRNGDTLRLKAKQYREENREALLAVQARWRVTHPNQKKEWDQQNKAYILAYAKEYRDSHKDDTKRWWKEWYAKNRDQVLERNRQKRQANLEQARERERQYESAHKGRSRIKEEKRRARKANLPDTLTQREWEIILDLFNHQCAYCGDEGELAQDHVIPVTQGGGYVKENIVPACKSCNSFKGNRSLPITLRLGI